MEPMYGILLSYSQRLQTDQMRTGDLLPQPWINLQFLQQIHAPKLPGNSQENKHLSLSSSHYIHLLLISYFLVKVSYRYISLFICMNQDWYLNRLRSVQLLKPKLVYLFHTYLYQLYARFLFSPKHFPTFFRSILLEITMEKRHQPWS